MAVDFTRGAGANPPEPDFMKNLRRHVDRAEDIINRDQEAERQKAASGGCAKKGCLGCLSVFVGFILLGILANLINPKETPSTEDEADVVAEAAESAKVDFNREEMLDSAMSDLDGLIGLEGVKGEVHKLVNLVKINEARKAKGLKTPAMTYHMVFTGNPGTGKTTVARDLAKIFVGLGIVGNPTLVEVDRSSLVGQYAGETAVKTNAKIDEAIGIKVRKDRNGKPVDLSAEERLRLTAEAPGGVLFIDEAYQLVSGESDQYGHEAIATILKRMEDDRAKLIVIVAGYTDEMRDFLSANSGLKSRFAKFIEFADYTNDELAAIFRLQAKKNGFKLESELDQGLEAIMAKLTKRRDRMFGNGRFVRQLLENATSRQADRLAETGKLDEDSLSTLTVADLGIGEKVEDVRAPTIEEVLAELDGLTGMQSVKDEIKRLIATCRANKLREEQGIENEVTMSYNFVFTGNPGTGKTTVARIVAKAFRALGLLERGHLVETDRSGLVAAYTGQTALKTNKLIDSAKGGILFIDEAYQLNQGANDQYGSEAVATLLKRMEDERGTMVVIIAGYKDEMKNFMAINSGLESRFNRVVEFPDFTIEELGQIFRQQAKKAKYTLSADVERWINPYIAMLTKDKGKTFGNGRWVRNLFEKTLERQAQRIISLENPSKEELLTIRMKDVGISLKDPNESEED